MRARGRDDAHDPFHRTPVAELTIGLATPRPVGVRRGRDRIARKDDVPRAARRPHSRRSTAVGCQVVRLRAMTGIGRVVRFWYASYRPALFSLTSFHRRA